MGKKLPADIGEIRHSGGGGSEKMQKKAKIHETKIKNKNWRISNAPGGGSRRDPLRRILRREGGGGMNQKGSQSIT